MSRVHERLVNFPVYKKRSKNNDGAYSYLEGGRATFSNTSMKKVKVQTCKGVVTWQSLEPNKEVNLYTVCYTELKGQL